MPGDLELVGRCCPPRCSAGRVGAECELSDQPVGRRTRMLLTIGFRDRTERLVEALTGLEASAR